MNLLGQTAFWVSMLSLFIGIQVFTKNPRDKLFLAFFGFCLTVSLWTLTFFLSVRVMRDHYYSVHLMFNLWLAPACLTFANFFARGSDRFSRFLLRISFSGAILISLLMLFLQVHQNAQWRTLLNFFPILVVVQVLWFMYQEEFGSKNAGNTPTHKKRRVVYSGALIVLSICTLDHVPQMGHVLPTIGNASLAVYLFLLGQALTHQRFFQLDRILARTLVILAVSMLLSLFYVIFYSWIRNNSAIFLLDSFLLSSLVIFLLDPIRDLMTNVTSVFQSKRQKQVDLEIEKALRQFENIHDEKELSRHVLATLEKVIEPEGISLFLSRGQGRRFKLEHSTGIVSRVSEVQDDFSLVREVKRLKRSGELPILLAPGLSSERERSMSRVVREAFAQKLRDLRNIGGQILLPIFSGEYLFGFVVAAVSRPPEEWGENWGFLLSVDRFLSAFAERLEGFEDFESEKEKNRLAALGEMSAGLAHEIRNPLGAIQGAAELIELPEGDKNRRFLNVIHEEVSRLNQVVTQFLDYSKPFQFQEAKVDLVSLTERVLSLLKPTLEPEIRIELNKGSDPVFVRGSAELLMQVWMNLIQNSAKALTGRDFPTISIQFYRREENGEFMRCVEFKDNGSGISAKNLEKIFIPFFTTSPSGTGLGLAISQRILGAHGGKIEVESEEGVNTSFSVILPEWK